ncbi:MAG: EAL domain-containing protein [Gammaproteobacteria bacterium]|nr:EAL domain-containing protein [Gammaproteobacteria bacterium]
MKTNLLTIRHKVLLVAILPALCLAGLLTFFFITQRSQAIEKSLRQEVFHLGEYVAKNSEFDLLTGNFQELEASLKRVSQERVVIYVKILDKSGHIVATLDKQTSPSFELPENATNPEHKFEEIHPITTTQLAINDYQVNPEAENKLSRVSSSTIGNVVIGATNIFAERMKQRLVRQALLIMGITIVFTIIFATFLAQTVSKPLTLLARGIDIIKNGNLQHRIKENSSGEIGMLEKNINEMAATLARAQAIERRQAANLLQSERIKAHTTLESIGEGVITTNENGIVTYINPAAIRLTGYKYEESVGHPLGEIFKSYFESTQTEVAYPIDSCLKHGHIVRHDALLKLVRKDGEEFIIRDTATPIRDHNSNIVGAVVIFDDFSTLHAMAEKLVYQAAHDDLTGLYNRREFETQLDLALNETKQFQSENTVFFLDLDQFKVVNDTCGHLAGDQLLKQISQLLKSKIREQDILARLGGDEFGIILRNCHHDKSIELADAILSVLQSFVFYWGHQQFNVGACLGIVELNNKFINTSDVLMAADSACYLAKETGRNSIHVYQPSDKEQQKRRSEIKWVQRLKSAVEKNNFTLYAQQIHPLIHEPSINHYEILLRLNLDGNIYTPMTFMSAAERYNLMPDIDRWVIHEIFSWIKKTQENGVGAHLLPQININLSGQSLTRDDFQKYVYDKVMACKIDHSLITFEITETATIANLAHAIEFMKTLKEMGCRFALDDFGSGLSSFGYLTSLPLDYIKIDGKIVRDIVTNPINMSIVESINQIAHIMQLQTIAEYVESDAIVNLLKSCKIDYAQGFHLDSPAPLDTLFD